MQRARASIRYRRRQMSHQRTLSTARTEGAKPSSWISVLDSMFACAHHTNALVAAKVINPAALTQHGPSVVKACRRIWKSSV